MNIYLDTEFIESFSRPSIFCKSRHFIDLISIGVVSDTGNHYTAISKEYNYNDANDWVKEHVIIPLYLKTVPPAKRNGINEMNFQKFYGLSNKMIADNLKRFVYAQSLPEDLIDPPADLFPTDINFYGYFCDYNWVVLCSLYGKMIDLPKGYPMYCRDLKQILDERVEKLDWYYGRDIWSNTGVLGQGPIQAGDYRATFKEKLEVVKKRMPGYPQDDNEHSALDDALWNKALHNFILTSFH